MRHSALDKIPRVVRSRRPSGPTPRSVKLILAICTLIELVLLGADLGIYGSYVWRLRAYEYGAFWGLLIRGGTPHFDGQPLTMFVTYAFLHGGILHLAFNMLALLAFGRAIVRRVGEKKFLWGYFLSAIGGAFLFGLIARPDIPMVGASGALFGLVGMWICWDYLDRRHYREPNGTTWRVLAFLVAYNLVFWILLSGQLAWETHLGGFITGWCMALFFGRPAGPFRRRGRRAETSGQPWSRQA